MSAQFPSMITSAKVISTSLSQLSFANGAVLTGGTASHSAVTFAGTSNNDGAVVS